MNDLRAKLREAIEAEARASQTADRLRREKTELREAVQEQCQGSMQELRATVVDLQQQLQESQVIEKIFFVKTTGYNASQV